MGAARGEATGAAPKIGAVGRARPVLLTAGVPREPILHPRQMLDQPIKNHRNM